MTTHAVRGIGMNCIFNFTHSKCSKAAQIQTTGDGVEVGAISCLSNGVRLSLKSDFPHVINEYTQGVAGEDETGVITHIRIP